eukprot:4438927-Prymnesium_polylepis.1
MEPGPIVQFLPTVSQGNRPIGETHGERRPTEARGPRPGRRHIYRRDWGHAATGGPWVSPRGFADARSASASHSARARFTPDVARGARDWNRDRYSSVQSPPMGGSAISNGSLPSSASIAKSPRDGSTRLAPPAAPSATRCSARPDPSS